MESDLKPKERFTGLSEVYDKARPDYSDEAIDFILKHCHLKPGNLVVDIGCGTGISSRAFSRKGLKVIGIEPNEDMRDQACLANEKLDSAAGLQLPIYQEGSAECTGLPDHYADAVISAQAFHWFLADLALAEFARILKPDGWVILLWNQRDESDPFTKAYGDVMRLYGKGQGRMESTQAEAGEALLQNDYFKGWEKVIFSNQQIMDEEKLCQRSLSVSYAPKDPKVKELMLADLKDVYKKYQQDGLIVLKYKLELYMSYRPYKVLPKGC